MDCMSWCIEHSFTLWRNTQDPSLPSSQTFILPTMHGKATSIWIYIAAIKNMVSKEFRAIVIPWKTNNETGEYLRYAPNRLLINNVNALYCNTFRIANGDLFHSNNRFRCLWSW